MTDYWAVYYRDKRLSGKPDEVEFEDEDFDLDKVLAAAEADPENWLDVLDGKSPMQNEE